MFRPLLLFYLATPATQTNMLFMAFVKCPLSYNVCGHNLKYFAAGMKWRRPSILGFKTDFLLSYFCFACEFERHVAPQALHFTITIFHNYEKQQWSATFWVFNIEIHRRLWSRRFQLSQNSHRCGNVNGLSLSKSCFHDWAGGKKNTSPYSNTDKTI